MTAPRYHGGLVFFCGKEREKNRKRGRELRGAKSQNHLEESRASGESPRVKMARRMFWTMRGEKGG